MHWQIIIVGSINTDCPSGCAGFNSPIDSTKMLYLLLFFRYSSPLSLSICITFLFRKQNGIKRKLSMTTMICSMCHKYMSMSRDLLTFSTVFYYKIRTNRFATIRVNISSDDIYDINFAPFGGSAVINIGIKHPTIDRRIETY